MCGRILTDEEGEGKKKGRKREQKEREEDAHTSWQGRESAGGDTSVREVESGERGEREVEEEMDPPVGGLHMRQVEALYCHTA